MLLEFRMKNFKNFSDGVVFSMEPTQSTRQGKYNFSDSILIKGKGKNRTKALSTTAIYGANAAGKTNIISAFSFLQRVIFQGNISFNHLSANNEQFNFWLIPNRNSSSPTELYIKFVVEKDIFIYELSLDLGCFGDFQHKNSVLAEKLTRNNGVLFERYENSLKIFTFEEINPVLKFIDNPEESLSRFAENSLDSQELFLNNGFKFIFPAIGKQIKEWFQSLLIIEDFRLTKFLKTPEFTEDINAVVKSFGIPTDSFDIKFENNDTKIYSKIGGIEIPIEYFESLGTRKFINFIPILVTTLVKGGILVIDELDNSLHTSVLTAIINIFHDPEINKNNAQLIFTTQNLLLLSKNLFRRDEIKFVEKDMKTGNSTIYTLDNFYAENYKTKEGDNYMKNYLKGVYGAINHIDLYSPLENIIKSK